MFKDENRHYSLRKLSVGLASVLIGISFASSMNGNSVKADTVSSQTSAIETKTSENKANTNADASKEVAKSTNSVDSNKITPSQTVLNKQATSNDVLKGTDAKQEQVAESDQNSVAEPQNNLLDDLGKQKASTENNQAETKNQENRLVDQINYKLTNNTSTDDNQDLGQNKVAPDETKSTSTTRSDTEKSIAGSSSVQQVNNQLNNRADDNSQTQPQTNKRLIKKMLAVNLTENRVINDSTDPSQIDPSHFADGTHWTTAGWTRTDKNTKVAKKSSLVISDWWDGHNESTPWRQPVTKSTGYALQDLNFTIDKNDIKKGNKILIATVQNLPTNTKQAIDGSQLFMSNWLLTDKYNINYQNKTIGNITVSQLDKDEIDLYYNSTTTLNNLNNFANDPTFNIHLGKYIGIANMDRKEYAKYHINFPYNYCVVTNHNIREYDTYIANTTNALPKDTVDQWYNRSRYNSSYGWSGLAITNSEHQLTGDKNINDADYIVKIKSINNSNVDPRSIRINTTTYFSVIDANGNPTDEITEMYDLDDKNGLKQAQDNLSSIDLWNATPTGYSYYSKQHDGSILLCIKQRPNIDSINQINQNSLRNLADGSYLANVQDPDHKQQIINNTVNKTKGWVAYTSDFKLGSYGIYQITDVTPSNYSKHTNLGTTTVEFLAPNSNIPYMPSGSANLETYKNVKISYIDDDATDSTKSDISSDSMTGLQNKASTYTVNIPKGYYLDDNNTSTGYTWNADHTAISYTFNEDQAKNDANPIEIHLKHKIQDVSATDPNAKQNNRYRMIENLPDGTKKTLIDLEIESHRTATKDLVTGKITYSDWISKDAVITNHTNNGNANDPSYTWRIPLDWFDNCTRTFSIPNGYEKVEQNGYTSYTSPLEKDNNGLNLIYFISYPDGSVGLDFEIGIPKDNATTYKAMPASCDFVINYQHNTQKVTDPSQLQTTGKRTITISMPKGHGDQMTIVQTVGYKRTGSLDLYTGKTTYTDWVFDADTSNVTVDGQPSTQYQAYVLKDGVVNYAPIKLPHINGYKAKLIQDKANPAMFMVSFVALPQQNNQSTSSETQPSDNVQSSQKEAQAERKQPEPIQTKPADDKQVDQLVRTISYTLMHNDSSNTADSFEPAQTDSAPLETTDVTQKVKPEPAKPAPIETQVPVETHDSLNKYTLTTNDPLPDTLVFNNIESDQATQTYDVVLSHQTEAAHRTHEVHETVDYVYADGSQASKSFTAKPLVFSQTGVHDLVTNITNWNGEWTKPQVFASVESPKIIGFTASKPEVKAIEVNHQSSDIHELVIYAANAQTAQIKYIDDVTGKTLETDGANGHFNESIVFSHNVNDQINKFKQAHYKLVSNNFDGQKYQVDNTKNVYEVHLTHEYQKVHATDLVTETVKFQYADGSQAQPTKTQTVNFGRDGIKDLVTGTTAWMPVDSQTLDAVDVPVLDGYTADTDQVPAVKVDFGDNDITKVVTYTANDQVAEIKIIDDTTGNVLNTQSATGKFGTEIQFKQNPDQQVIDLQAQHYELVSDNFNGQKYQADNAKNQFEIHVKHQMMDVQRTDKVTETVRYQDNHGNMLHPASIQTKMFTEHGITDQVTGKTVWTPAKSQTMDAVSAPEITGYTPNKQSVPTTSVNFGDKDINDVIVYAPVSEVANIKYIDDTTGKTLVSAQTTGDFGSQIKFDHDPVAQIKAFENQGYKLVSNSYGKTAHQFSATQRENNFEVHFKHSTMPVSDTDKVTETIHYLGPDGNKLAPDKTQTITFTRHGVKNQVTDHVDWNPVEPQEFNAVKSPIIDGYQADAKVVDGSQVLFGDQDVVINVHYTKLPEQKQEQGQAKQSGINLVNTYKVTPEKVVTVANGTVQKTKQNTVKNSAQSTTQDTKQLPQTGNNEQANLLSIIGGSLMTSLALFGLGKKKKHKN